MKKKVSNLIDTLLCVLFGGIFGFGILCILAGINHL